MQPLYIIRKETIVEASVSGNHNRSFGNRDEKLKSQPTAPAALAEWRQCTDTFCYLFRLNNKNWRRAREYVSFHAVGDSVINVNLVSKSEKCEL